MVLGERKAEGKSESREAANRPPGRFAVRANHSSGGRERVGQKVNPIGLRVGITHGWQSNWFAKKKQFPEFLNADMKLRNYIRKKFHNHGIVRVYIERKTEKSVKATIYTAKPGILIGRGGTEVEVLRRKLEQIEGRQVFVNIKEVKDYATNAMLVAEGVGFQLEKRISFRRAIKQAITRAMKMKRIKG